jgi:hypothetical protein
VSAAALLAAAFAGGILGGITGVAVSQFAARRSSARRSSDDDSGLATVLHWVADTKKAVEGAHQDLNVLSINFNKFAAASAPRGSAEHDEAARRAGSTAAEYQSERDRIGRGESPGFRYAAPPTRGYDQPTRVEAGYRGSGDDLVLEEDGFAGLDPGRGVTSGPPAGALNVEARDDRIVTTASYPPEAWLEIDPGRAEGRVSLNPTMALNEIALRRLSTFFEWQGARPGASYQTLTPATVRWDDGQRVGTLVSRGVARPR